MIREYCSFVVRAFEVVTSFIHDFDNCKHFLVIYLVIEFSSIELPTVKYDEVKHTVVVSLRSYTFNYMIECICFEQY